MRSRLRLLAIAPLLPLIGIGCALVPQKLHEPQFHNPWPQLRTVAVAPFYNLSENPTVNQDEFAHAYFSELQQIPGFEVVPVGVTRRAMRMHGIFGNSGEDFQRLAQIMDVDAVVVGTVNEFSPYYPPKLAMTVRWYTANPCFHPMPNGYGLPWGRAEEEYIPDSLVEAAEFDLATAQLATQTPSPPTSSTAPTMGTSPTRTPLPTTAPQTSAGASGPPTSRFVARQQSANEPSSATPPAPSMTAEELAPGVIVEVPRAGGAAQPNAAAIASPQYFAAEGMPANWPDPRGFIPDAPKPVCDPCRPTTAPVLSHTRSYDGSDSDFTAALAGYYEFRDEARFGGWQAYLQRSEDFIRFCCYMHITEMLAARGGARETKVVYRWPIGRYER